MLQRILQFVFLLTESEWDRITLSLSCIAFVRELLSVPETIFKGTY